MESLLREEGERVYDGKRELNIYVERRHMHVALMLRA